MAKKIKALEEKILNRRKKLIKACLEHNEAKMIKHQHKLLQLSLQQGKR